MWRKAVDCRAPLDGLVTADCRSGTGSHGGAYILLPSSKTSDAEGSGAARVNPGFTIISVLILYLIILLVIGFWGRRESTSVAGYYVAGKKLPGWVIAFSSNATGESAWLLLGLTGAGYLVGIHALWITLGEILGIALAWTLVACPFKEYTDRYDSIIRSRLPGSSIPGLTAPAPAPQCGDHLYHGDRLHSGPVDRIRKSLQFVPGHHLYHRGFYRSRSDSLLHHGGGLQSGGLQRSAAGDPHVSGPADPPCCGHCCCRRMDLP